MTDTKPVLDIDRVRKLFDLAGSVPRVDRRLLHRRPLRSWSELREKAPVHEGVVHELSGLDTPAVFHGLPDPDRPHFSAFSYAACDSRLPQ